MKKKKFIKYILFAIFSSGINVLVYYLFYKFILSNIIIGNIIAYSISISVQFFTNKKYVFKSSNNKKTKEFSLFLIVKVSAFLIDTIVLIICTKVLRFEHLISKIISNASTTISNYSLNDKFVFKNN